MATWTKQTYERIAQIFREQRAELDAIPTLSSSTRSVADDLLYDWARELADMFEEDNPRFDRARFYAACDVVKVESN